MICDKEYHISYKLYAYFLYNKLKYYFAKEEYIYFQNFKLKKLKNKKIL